MLYFAYGSNMLPETMSRLCPGSECRGAAILHDYRLAFTRTSQRWQGGVADIVPADGMCVYGVLYDIDPSCIKVLDAKEGVSIGAYRQINVSVTCCTSNDIVRALAYEVCDKSQYEIRPPTAYLEQLLAGAEAVDNIPEDYIDFLHHLEQDGPNGFRTGLLVYPNKSCPTVHGIPAMRISTRTAKALKLRRFAVVDYENHNCLVRVIRVSDMPEDRCELAQHIRRILGFPGLATYGQDVQIHPLRGGVFQFPFVSPRTLTLIIERPSRFDSEMNICVLGLNNIRRLGISPGDRVTILAVKKDGQVYRMSRLNLRVFTGSVKKIRRPGAEGGEIDYPHVDELYLDMEGRKRIELGDEAVSAAVHVQPHVMSLFLKQLVFYGIALLLGIDVIYFVVDGLQVLPTGARLPLIIVTLILAAFLTFVISIFDIRARVQT